MDNPAFDLIIFDCDGVLVDSELLASEVLSEELAEHGVDVTPRECRERFTGASLLRVKEMVFQASGIELPTDFEQRVRRKDRDVFEERLQMMPDMDETLNMLTTPFCIASSGRLEKINHSLELTGLDKFFPSEHCFSAEMVEHGKPAPDLFLHAAKQMNVDPKRCLVIEDSPLGIKGAKEAQMGVFGFAGGSHAGPGFRAMLELASVEIVFEEMYALPNLIQLYRP